MKIQWESFNYEFNQYTNEWEETESQEEVEESHSLEGMSIEDFLGDEEYKAAIQTPWGVFNVTDPFAPYRRFEMWIGNTDFNVSQSFINKISNIRGIELVKPLSRYTFIIGIGKLFKFDEVRLSIEMVGGVSLTSSNIPKEVSELINSFGDKKFAIYVYPNKKFDYTIETDVDFNSKIENFYEEKRKSNGVILSNG